MTAPQPCVAMYGGHICGNDEDGHDGPHTCMGDSCGATWSDDDD